MVLLERDSHLNVLRAALGEAESEGRVALVYGEAGIGKTSLVEHFINENKQLWRILQGACDSLFTPRPLGPLYDIASQTGGKLSILMESESDRNAIFSECLNELKTQNSILVIEDVQWADEATLDLLKYLGRRIQRTRSLAILTYRDDEIGATHPLRILLGDLATSRSLHRIPLSSLTNEAVRELAKGKNFDPIELHSLTNGNPFYVTEVLAVESGIPETVRDAVLARAARLSPSARAALEAAAVIGSRAEAWLLSQISEVESEYIEECIAKGMLQLQGELYVFRHELSRQTILDSISSQRKLDLHRNVLDTLKEMSVTRENLARLAHHAEALNDAQFVLEFAPLAAWWASAASSHREATRLYELALRFAHKLPPSDHAQMLESYAVELDFMDRMTDEIIVLQKAMKIWRSMSNRLREAENLAELSEILVMTGRMEESEEASRAAITILEALSPSVELARSYKSQCFIRMMQRDCSESIAWGEKAVALAERLGDKDTLARIYNYMGSAALVIEYERGKVFLERCVDIARANKLVYDIGSGLSNLGGMSLEVFQLKEAERYLSECIVHAMEHDSDYHLFYGLAWKSRLRMHQGRWVETVEITDKVLERKDMGGIARIGALLALAYVRVRQGDATAVGLLAEVLDWSKLAGARRMESPRALRAEAAWLSGDFDLALAEARAAYDIALSKKHPWMTGELAFWRWRAGENIERPVWIAKPFALQIAGNWRAAAKDWEERGCPYEQAMALMDGDEAAQLGALEIFERLGARPILEILKRQMRAQGIRIPRGPRPATRDNPFGLTAREMEVLGSLSKGSSNIAIARQLSLSTRTVEHHIASILQKMGVETRAEAAALALKDGFFPPAG